MPNSILSSKEILLQILTIIDYQNNKEVFVDKFLQTSLQEAYAKIIATLPEDKQLFLEKELETKKPDERSYVILQRYVGPQNYLKIMTQSTQDFLEDYINEIKPTLSLEQKQKLSEYLSSVVF